MTKLWIAMRRCVCVLCMLLALAFVWIEGYLLVSGDWLLFDNNIAAFLQLIVRVLIIFWALGITFHALFDINHDHLCEGIGMLIASLISVPFLSNHFGWCFVLFSLLFVLTEKRIWKRI